MGKTFSSPSRPTISWLPSHDWQPRRTWHSYSAAAAGLWWQAITIGLLWARNFFKSTAKRQSCSTPVQRSRRKHLILFHLVAQRVATNSQKPGRLRLIAARLFQRFLNQAALMRLKGIVFHLFRGDA